MSYPRSRSSRLLVQGVLGVFALVAGGIVVVFVAGEPTHELQMRPPAGVGQADSPSESVAETPLDVAPELTRLLAATSSFCPSAKFGQPRVVRRQLVG